MLKKSIGKIFPKKLVKNSVPAAILNNIEHIILHI